MMAAGVLAVALIAATVSDIRTRKIPDFVHILLLLSGGVAIFFYEGGWVSRAAGLLAVGLMMLGVGLTMPKLGGGDIKMGASLAFAVGIIPACYALLLGFGLAAVFLLIRKRRRKIEDIVVPLAPFISAGCAAVFILSPS